MIYEGIYGVPDFEVCKLREKSSRYVVLIPVINEGDRLHKELRRAKHYNVHKKADIVICDGGSTDGSVEADKMDKLGVAAILIKKGKGRQGAQLRMGFWWSFQKNYDGIITIDGNNKDSIEDVDKFIEKMDEGYGFVQGSRFVKGGMAIRTPVMRLIAVRLIHAPVISVTAGHRFTDTTNAFRGYSAEYLKDKRVEPLRDIFDSYELLAYLSTRASQLGYRVCEVPVTRRYPEGKVPTKISAWKGQLELLKILFWSLMGKYEP